MADERREPGHIYGIHRVLDTDPCLPQAAKKLDNRLPIFSNEILIDVERLNIDAASFVQMEEETVKNPQAIADIVLKNTRERGKQENRVTGSGGMLIGRLRQVGSKYRGPLKAKVGDRVSSLVSLTLTPLHLDEIQSVDLKTHQIQVKGHAILFESSIAAPLPKDLSEAVAMAVYDVAGAPATTYAICRPGQTLVVIGAGGKAGLLSCAAGRKKLGRSGKIIAIEPHPKAAAELKALRLCDTVLTVDATVPTEVASSVERATRGKMAHRVVNVASVPNTELSAILSCRPTGKVLFFSMATSFSRVTLGAEGVAARPELIFGNGYYPNHADFAIGLLKRHSGLRSLFLRRYGA